ncbi:MAG: GHMP kinase [Euryarchaeota archaeon]|nr:GHMP kinase [Euryarchaeota archaeon]
MVGTRTPFRMSFIGGGSDLKEFYEKIPGRVISTSINKYMYIFSHQYFDDKIQVKYSKTELVDDVEKIQHPIVREALRQFNIKSIDINSIADIPSGSGLGSSSAYTVGLLHNLNTFIKKYVSLDNLAEEACRLEIDILGEPIGKQDQYASAFGGLNKITFFPDGKVDVEPIIMDRDLNKNLQNNLLLFYLGSTRKASSVLTDQKSNLISNQSKFDNLKRMTDLVDQMHQSLIKSDLDSFGKILDQNWMLKKTLSNKISNEKIDELYSLGKKNGAKGGKILGAGGGGFILFYCEKKYQNKLRDAMRKLKEVDFHFENSGTKIIYNSF